MRCVLLHSRAEFASAQILHFTVVFLPFYLFVSSCYLIRLTQAHVLIGAQLSTENVVSVWRGGGVGGGHTVYGLKCPSSTLQPALTSFWIII